MKQNRTAWAQQEQHLDPPDRSQLQVQEAWFDWSQPKRAGLDWAQWEQELLKQNTTAWAQQEQHLDPPDRSQLQETWFDWSQLKQAGLDWAQ